MTGIRKRVTVGFLSIVCLLFFSGMVSFIELSHLSRDTDEILKANQRNIELAREMLSAAHEQNLAMIELAVFGNRSFDSLSRSSLDRLERTLAVAQEEAVDKSFLDSLAVAATRLRLLTDSYLLNGPVIPRERVVPPFARDTTARIDRAGERWYHDEYDGVYRRLTSAIQNYMTSTQSSLAPRTEQMKKNAYRAVTPVLISLLVMIAIVLMLYYFMMIYCVNPIVGMNKALGDYLSFHIPFKVRTPARDEMAEMQEKIESLIAQSKTYKA